MNRLILLILVASGCCCADDQVVHFDLLKGYLIVTRCSIRNLPPLTAIVDTGTSETVLDSRLLRQLSRATSAGHASFATREVQVRSVLAPSVTLGPLQSGPLATISADLSGFSAQVGVHVDVIVGMDLLRKSDFLIDYDARTLRFGPLPEMPHHAPLETRTGLATISLAGLGVPLRLLVDTGFPELLLFKSRLGQKARTRNAALNLFTTAGTDKLQEFDSDALQIGDWRLGRKNVLIVDDSSQAAAEFDGLLGPRFLGAGRIAFDFQNHLLSWDESTRPIP
jgi:hypothetical protein